MSKFIITVDGSELSAIVTALDMMADTFRGTENHRLSELAKRIDELSEQK